MSLLEAPYLIELQTSQQLLAFNAGLRRDLGLIVLILNMIILKSFTGPTHFLSANVGGPVSFAVSGAAPMNKCQILSYCP